MCGTHCPDGLECDHIIPVAAVLLMADLTVLQKIERYTYNPGNLRSLCQKCHRRVTAAFNHALPRLRGRSAEAAVMDALFPVGQVTLEPFIV